MKVVFTGSRDGFDTITIQKVLKKLHPKTMIIHGDAPGVDSQIDYFARKLGFKNIRPFIAEWHKFGKAAGPIRNRLMLDQEPHCVIGFHRNVGASKGTRDCLLEAMRRHIPIAIHGSAIWELCDSMEDNDKA